MAEHSYATEGGAAISNPTLTGLSGSDSSVIAASLEVPALFSAIFERHFDVVHRYIQRRVGVDLADDLASETFVVAFDKRAAYDLERPDARPWLLGIATNLVFGHWRAERRQLRAVQRTGCVLPSEEATENSSPRLFCDADVAAALTRLNVPDRDALLLLVWGDLSYEEIAIAVDAPIGTVRSRIARARQSLRASIEPVRAPRALTEKGNSCG
jgi:RNA polymerase sigma factor (sigma-70 family)